ncbi:MAG: YbaK/EbsC family protein [Halopseudomonas aestusnigri]
MAVSITIQNYLKDLNVRYVPLEHEHTETSSMTAEVSHVPGSRLVKAVVIKDQTKYMMALLPASHHLRLKELTELLGREVELASEEEFSALFTDCDKGAVPALGLAYGLEVVVEDSLNKNDDLFFEGGDHETLVHMEARTFENLVSSSIHGHFSHHDKHPENRSGFRYEHS